MARLDQRQLSQFRQQGFVVVEDLLDPETYLDPLVSEYERRLDDLARQLLSDGQIRSTYAGMEFGTRLTRIYQDSGQVHSQYFDFSLPQKGVTMETPMWHGPAAFDVLTAPPLLDAVESIIGSEIYSNPTQHVRIKPPEHLTPKNPDTGIVQLGATPWHQDSGVVTADADESEILTVWIPVWDADEAAGCLHLVPRSHREGLKVHCPGGTATSPSTLGIPDELFRIADAVPVPMRRGGALFMHRLTCHGSLPNRSDRIRWSLDLRYNPTGQHTGRPVFPGFVARSRRNPESELDDPAVWAGLWRQARARLAGLADPSYNRWSGKHPACA